VARRRRSLTRRAGKWVLATLASFCLVTLVLVGLYRYLPVPYTPLMGIRAWQGIPSLQRRWLALNQMGPLPLAVLASEDQRFFDHWGLDLMAIRLALDHNRDHRHLRGASTISQQTAKNVFLWPGRSWLRKGLELWFTLWIEALWDKRRILEVYLNVIEFGPGVYGAHAAGSRWYRKHPTQLSRSEAAALAVILPSPLTADPRALDSARKRRKAWALRQMRNLEGQLR
jgi:monofunctional biosynthetic peptidoglycan transglycosylase